MTGENAEQEQWLTVPDLARRWPHFSESSLRRWVDAGDIPSYQGAKGRTRRVRKSDADAYEANGFKKVARHED